jgi:hypothetical protein
MTAAAVICHLLLLLLLLPLPHHYFARHAYLDLLCDHASSTASRYAVSRHLSPSL